MIVGCSPKKEAKTVRLDEENDSVAVISKNRQIMISNDPDGLTMILFVNGKDRAEFTVSPSDSVSSQLTKQNDDGEEIFMDQKGSGLPQYKFTVKDGKRVASYLFVNGQFVPAKKDGEFWFVNDHKMILKDDGWHELASP